MTEKEARSDSNNPSDEKNPQFLFNNTHTDLLVLIANKKIDARKLALEQLRNRNLDKDGKWIGDADDKHPYL